MTTINDNKMWEIIYQATGKSIVNITQTPKGYAVTFGLCSAINASTIIYKKLDNAIKCANRLANYKR